MRAIPATQRRSRLLTAGDLLLEKSGGGDLQPVGVVMLYDHPRSAVCSNFIARMPVAAGFDARYLVYLHAHLYSIRLNVRSIKQTTGIQNLDSSSYLAEVVSFPSLAEQQAIVQFLDHVDRRVRRAIRGRQRLIALLEEYRQAVIHRAVTRGLDPDVPLKPSGVEWLGDIPAHWEVIRLKFLARAIVDCLHATPEYSDSGSFPAIRTADISPGVVRVDTARRVESDVYEVWTQRLEPAEGDILYSREGERFGIAACVPKNVRLCISQRMMIFRLKEDHNPTFVMWALNSPEVYAQASKDVMGATAPHVNISTIRNFALSIPTRREQDQIVAWIGESTEGISDVMRSARDEIHLLRELRTRLIADVVTGKLDVREAAARIQIEATESLDVPDFDDDEPPHEEENPGDSQTEGL